MWARKFRPAIGKMGGRCIRTISGPRFTWTEKIVQIMKKIKSTVISVVHAHAPEKSDYVWTLRRPLVFGTSNAFSVGGNKRGRDGPFFFLFLFALLMIGYQRIKRCRSEALGLACKPKLRSQVSDPGGRTAERLLLWRIHLGTARTGGATGDPCSRYL